MDSFNNQTISSEALVEAAKAWDLDKWSAECAHLSPSQLSSLVHLAAPASDSKQWQEKLYQLYRHLPEKTGIESFGKELNKAQILEIIHLVKNNSKDTHKRQKLSSLFAGVAPLVFKEVLFHASQEDLAFLREEAITETIQHHLSLITNELNSEFNDFCLKVAEMENEIKNTDLQKMNKEGISDVYRSLASFHDAGKNILNHTARILTMAWNANRSDLIQDLGRIKELSQKYLIETVGKEAQDEIPASGLYQLLEKKVDELFSDNDANGNRTIMKNTTPALEALVKFSVWYIQDYVEVGLLPDMIQSDDQDSKHELDNLKQREQLFISAEKNLNRMGLHTLADLKRAHIYSKKALMEHISANQKGL